MRILQLLTLMMLVGFAAQSQDLDNMSLEDLKTLKGEKEGVKKNIDAEIADLDKRIKEFPGWTKGFGGTVGLNFGGANDWFGQDVETATSRGLGLAFNAFANNNGSKSFWHNTLTTFYNTNNQKNTDLNDDGSLDDEEEITNNASFFGLNSLGGYQVFNNFFASAEARYETTFNKFNDPGKLTFSAGFTYKPINNLVIVVHPLAYQINLPSNELSSASGAKIGATYTGDIYPGVKWTSELNAFLAYSGDSEADAGKPFSPYSAGDLTNWTWFNTFAVADVFKGIGLGLSIGLRDDKQLGYAKNVADPGIQMIYNLGLSYSLAN